MTFLEPNLRQQYKINQLSESGWQKLACIFGDIVKTLGYKDRVIKVPEGHCWIEGDHTGHSMDSNNFGPVSLGLLTAKASCIVWPPSRWQVIKTCLPASRVPLNMNPIISGF